MRARTRKFIGTTLLVVLIPLYALIVVAAAGATMANQTTLVQSLFFLVTGLVWVLPAMLLVSWMSRPDRLPNS